MQYGVQSPAVRSADGNQNTDEGTGDNPDLSAEFDRLIKGEYKELYNAKVQETVQKRLKNTKETADKYTALAPVLDMLSKRYGVDSSDISALSKAIENDDSYYESEALERGISVEQLKAIKKVERENAELKRQMNAQNAEKEAKRIYGEWVEQAERAKAKYPDFELETEIQNPQFADLLRRGIDAETAYTVIHKDEIIPAAMQYTAKRVEQKIRNSVIANGARPSENGINSPASSVVKNDVTQLTRADREEIIRRVGRGEKISF